MSQASAAGPPNRPKAVLDTDLATRALQRGLISADQLKEALAEQGRDLAERKEGVRPLGAILVAKRFLTPAQLQELILEHLAPAPPVAKAALFGKYQLVRELGRGGMGVVYEAVDTGLGRKVALKTMIVNPMADPKDAKLDEERFLREAQLSAGLSKHPHIVGVYEAGVIQGKRYLAMELVDGKPMSDWRDDPAVTLKQEVEVLRAAALAVHHAHEQGIIHRDLKPANILVDGKNEPHITDFGLAKLVGENLSVSLTGAGMVVGTPAYISPEQAQGLRSTDRRTDVYALGVILFEIATGRHPFLGQTAMEILMKASKNPVPSASALLKVRLTPVQAKGLDVICQKALAKKPGERHRDAASFAADLARWLGGDEIKSAISTRRSPRVRTRNWWALGAAAALLLGTGVFFLRSSPPGESEAEVRKKTQAEEEKKKLAAAQRAAEARAKAAERELSLMKGKIHKARELKNPETLRPGLVGEYFAGANFDIPSLRRIDPAISFHWNWGVPAWPDAPLEYCTMRWRAFLQVPETGPYTLQVICNDGLRLFLDDAELLSRWVPQSGVVETTVCTLETGYHALVLEYLKGPGQGGIAFSCKKLNESAECGVLRHDPSSFVPLSQKPTVDHADLKGLPGAQEAEKLEILESLPGATAVLPWGREQGFLLWGKVRIGDRLKLRFDAPEAGERTLILALGRSRNSGIVKIAVNGRVLVPNLDLFSPQNFFLEAEFTKVALAKGGNELEFTMIGSNPGATEWRKGDGVNKMSIDYLRIR
ncbi:MAG TPA: protein kinase [Planctomycetota bacterium]|nr:protein kinase [Planctomycetota bacterium]